MSIVFDKKYEKKHTITTKKASMWDTNMLSRFHAILPPLEDVHYTIKFEMNMSDKNQMDFEQTLEQVLRELKFS